MSVLNIELKGKKREKYWFCLSVPTYVNRLLFFYLFIEFIELGQHTLIDIRDVTTLNIILNRTVSHPRFNTHFETAVFPFYINFYVTSFNVFLPELALSELQ